MSIQTSLENVFAQQNSHDLGQNMLLEHQQPMNWVTPTICPIQQSSITHQQICQSRTQNLYTCYGHDTRDFLTNTPRHNCSSPCENLSYSHFESISMPVMPLNSMSKLEPVSIMSNDTRLYTQNHTILGYYITMAEAPGQDSSHPASNTTTAPLLSTTTTSIQHALSAFHSTSTESALLSKLPMQWSTPSLPSKATQIVTVPATIHESNESSPIPKIQQVEVDGTTTVPVESHTSALISTSPDIASSRSFKVKKRKVHESKTKVKPTIFVCDASNCGKVFSRAYNLTSHMKTHSTDRPFLCRACPLAFARRHDKDRHERLHTGEKPYSCERCGCGFMRNDALHRHLRMCMVK